MAETWLIKQGIQVQIGQTIHYRTAKTMLFALRMACRGQGWVRSYCYLLVCSCTKAQRVLTYMSPIPTT